MLEWSDLFSGEELPVSSLQEDALIAWKRIMEPSPSKSLNSSMVKDILASQRTCGPVIKLCTIIWHCMCCLWDRSCPCHTWKSLSETERIKIYKYLKHTMHCGPQKRCSVKHCPMLLSLFQHICMCKDDQCTFCLCVKRSIPSSSTPLRSLARPQSFVTPSTVPFTGVESTITQQLPYVRSSSDLTAPLIMNMYLSQHQQQIQQQQYLYSLYAAHSLGSLPALSSGTSTAPSTSKQDATAPFLPLANLQSKVKDNRDESSTVSLAQTTATASATEQKAVLGSIGESDTDIPTSELSSMADESTTESPSLTAQSSSDSNADSCKVLEIVTSVG